MLVGASEATWFWSSILRSCLRDSFPRLIEIGDEFLHDLHGMLLLVAW